MESAVPELFAVVIAAAVLAAAAAAFAAAAAAAAGRLQRPDTAAPAVLQRHPKFKFC